MRWPVTCFSYGAAGFCQFKGGVGRYSGFTHIDTRGRNADW